MQVSAFKIPINLEFSTKFSFLSANKTSSFSSWLTHKRKHHQINIENTLPLLVQVWDTCLALHASLTVTDAVPFRPKYLFSAHLIFTIIMTILFKGPTENCIGELGSFVKYYDDDDDDDDDMTTTIIMTIIIHCFYYFTFDIYLHTSLHSFSFII